MTIYILHYHFNLGGVRKIIESQIQSLQIHYPRYKVKLICGGLPQGEEPSEIGVEVLINEKINYLFQDTLRKADIQIIYEELLVYFRSILNEDDVLHAHNINLGKNPVLTYVFYRLAIEGYKVVNHTHDFPEDRSQNWKFLSEIIEQYYDQKIFEVLYPNLPNYITTVINADDMHRYDDYHIGSERLLCLANPIQEPQLRKDEYAVLKKRVLLNLDIKDDKLLVTYPVRVIQRKNIGEFILLSVLFAEKAYWLVTMPPENPMEIVHYVKWKSFCEKNNIEIVFEAGKHTHFESLMWVSDFCISTSLQEGFGMAFMEPWLYDSPVIGRRLPNISFFEKTGMNFSRMYEKLMVPFNNDWAEFSELPIDDQRKVIEHVIENDDLKREIFTRNHNLGAILDEFDSQVTSHNKQIIAEHFSLKSYAKILDSIYTELSSKP